MDPDKRERYLYGHCGELAVALAALTGWRVQVVKHAGIISPDGRWFVDAAGVHDARPLMAAAPGPGAAEVREDAAELLRRWRVP